MNYIRKLFRLLFFNKSFRGKSRIIRLIEKVCLKMGTNKIEIIENGIYFEYNFNIIQHIDMYYGLYEFNEIKFMKKILREDSTFFDVGTALGYYLIQSLHKIKEEGQIHCFEPCKRTYDILLNNFNKSKTNVNIKLNNLAVSDKNEIVSLDYNDGQSKITDKNASLNTEKVDAIRLDDYISRHNIEKIDFIKMDIEGHELNAIKGLEGYFAKNKYPIIMTEILNDLGINLRRDMYSFMNSYGYNNYIIRDHKLTNVAIDNMFLLGYSSPHTEAINTFWLTMNHYDAFN